MTHTFALIFSLSSLCRGNATHSHGSCVMAITQPLSELEQCARFCRHLVLSKTSIRHLVYARTSLVLGHILSSPNIHKDIWSMPKGPWNVVLTKPSMNIFGPCQVVLEKILESPLDCKEIQPVHSKGNQPWDFFGRNDAKAETPVLWPPHAKS